MGQEPTRVRAKPAPKRKAARKTPLQARSRSTVDAILEATTRVLAARGYAGTNTNLIAEIAGVSVGSLYQYFRNKQALMAALRERHSEQMHHLIELVINDAEKSSLREVVTTIVRALLDAHYQDAVAHAIIERETSNVQHDDQAARHLLLLVERVLRRHAAEITAPNLTTAAYFIFETIISLVHARIAEGPAKPSSDTEAEIVAVVIGYLTVPRPPQEKGVPIFSV
jgi:AcrR family transcriptional regulator